MRDQGKSSFSSLIEYLLDKQSKQHRVGAVSITNCQSATMEAAIEEVLATQHMNKRATGDKTYHLILSFRPGESPEPEIMKALEERVCAALGFSEHQRISVVHNDTDNVHMHIAINKIHPKKNTMHEPYRAYRTIAEICEKLEAEYGLERDNHTPRQTLSQGKVNDMEHHTGIESLASWIKSQCLDDLNAAKTWGELHEVMQANGLQLAPRGNGLVIVAVDSGLRVKPSTVSRGLSKGALEKKLGAFEASEFQLEKVERVYKERPIKLKGVDTVELYAQYKLAQDRAAQAQKELLIKERGLKAGKIKAVKASNKMRRQAIKLMGGSAFSKRILYAQASRALRNNIQKINQESRAERNRIYESSKRLAWADWLKEEGLQGNQEAVAALRARARREKKNTLEGRGEKAQAGAGRRVVDTLTKKGTFVLRGENAIKDDGQSLRLEEQAGLETFKEAIKLAAEKYGNTITVTGNAVFKARAVKAAADSNLNITFADPVLEAKRKNLLVEKNNERTNDRFRAGRSVSNARGGGRDTDRGGVDSNRQRGEQRAGATRELFSKPHVAKLGTKPPPQAQNRLRGMSELGVVRFTERGQVLLPGNVSNNLEQQRAESANQLRRDDAGRRGITSKYSQSQIAAMDKYIAEREEKRQKGLDISKHVRYNGDIEGLAFAGLRKVDGENLALIKKGREVSVMPVSNATAGRLRRLRIGDEVAVNEQGSIITKGRGRSR